MIGKKSNRRRILIIVLAVILVVITFMDTFLVFQMTSQKTRDSGVYQIENMSGNLENEISDAKNLTMKLALEAQPLVSDKTVLESYIIEQKKQLYEETNGECYNVYIAGTGWDIIPDLTNRDGFVATERGWYQGALQAKGNAYVTSPYMDALTGNICYTISVLLDDGDTVLGIDYTLEHIEDYVSEMYENGASDALIVTEDGTIAGCVNEDLIGRKFIDVLPAYAGIYGLAKNSEGVVSIKVRKNFLYDNLFATRSASGWYLIVCENDWQLYKNSYLQMIATIGLNIALFVLIISLYIMSRRNQEKAEEALDSKEKFLSNISAELREPLNRIMTTAGRGNADDTEDYKADFLSIRQSGEQLSGMIEQMISYSSIVRAESKKKKSKKNRGGKLGLNIRYRTYITILLLITMCVSLYSNISATYQWGGVSMQKEVEGYNDELSEWIATQKSILDMFCSVISTNPEILDDYEGAVAYLDNITKRYSEISVSYMTNPQKEHTVIMNNGWVPDEDWHVEERQWYIDTIASESGWNISAPYYDEQTGLYCLTLSERVYDAKTGDFLGNFGIDFYMDKLVDILGNSYSNQGYAFLADADGEIINHPYGNYQMSESNVVNVSELPYKDSMADGQSIHVFDDYDGIQKLVIAMKNKDSGFTVYVVSSVWTIFKQVVIYGIICLIAFLVCLVTVFYLITNLLRWKDEANEQLQESADAAIAAGRAKSQFLAQMSHEIRTPINAVLGMNEMILRESTTPDIREYASNIQSAGRTLLTLINSILDFSKIEDGKMEIVPANYGTASMINDLVNAIAERARAKELSLIVNVDETLPVEMYGDDVRIRQVISNLLTNAVKYTEKGSVTLTFGIQERFDNEIELYVEVKDTGIGIRDEDREKLFESFQRLDEQRNRNIEGTGLGMSIVTKLLDMMGSRLLVDSVYGEGSTFYFTLKQGIVNDEPIGNYEERLVRASIEEESGEYLYAPKAKVLIVDDNEMNLKVAKSLLKRTGIVPDMAISGFEALGLVKEQEYDMVFLDHMMPKMDGIETLKKMRQEALLSEHVVVIALTANAIVGAKEKYLSAGFNDYLSKPIEVKELERKLIKYLPEKKVGYKEISNKDKERMPEETPDAKPEDGYSLSELMRIREQCPQINILSGMAYCMDSREFYESMLGDFAAGDRSKELSENLERKDYESYRIAVHALKGNAKNIGADVLSEHARELEMAVKEERLVYVDAHHEEFLMEYQAVREKIQEMLQKSL